MKSWMAWRQNIKPSNWPPWLKSSSPERIDLSTRLCIEQIIGRDAARIAQALSLPLDEARGEAQTLLARALNRSRAWLLAHGLDPWPEGCIASINYASWLERRLRGEPVAYILGEREFYGLSFAVDSRVLIPRPETELLVEIALSMLPTGAAKVLDLGTGSGCIAVAMANHARDSQFLAVDNSHDALLVAAINTQRHQCENVDLLHSDWFDQLGGLRFDVIVSNPPYVAAEDPHLRQGDLRFEPNAALTPGAEALGSIAQIAAGARTYLRAGGWLILEHGHEQASGVQNHLEAHGFVHVRTLCDLASLPRVSLGRAP